MIQVFGSCLALVLGYGQWKEEKTTPQEFTAAVRPVVLSNKSFNKIFCIGYNKTGTTTIEAVLRLCGYNLPNQQEQEIRLTKQCFNCDYTGLKSFVSSYDAFQDLPFSQGEIYVAADALFPNSRFILTERDSGDWFKSMTSFHKKVFNFETLENLSEQDVLTEFNYRYKGYSHQNKKRLLTNFVGEKGFTNWGLLYDKDYYINEYEQRNNRIKKYFQNSLNKLLVIDLTAEDTTEKICRFLNIPVELEIDMPHANRT